MDFIMVNSNSLGSERNGNTKASCMQENVLHNKTQSTSPLTATSATQSKNDFTETNDSGESCKTDAVEPTPSQTDSDENKTDYISTDGLNNMEPTGTKKSLFCSVPLEKVQTILSRYTLVKSDGSKMKIPRKVMCLYCDRTFVNVNLRHKHVERCHSSKQLRRVSLRKHQNFLTSTPCVYCDKFTCTEHTLKDLFKHLVENHSNKYFGCLSCEDRYLNSSHLADHNALYHNLVTQNESLSDSKDLPLDVSSLEKEEIREEIPVKITRRRQKARKEKMFVNSKVGSNIESSNMKNLRSRKLAVKSSRMILKRSKRLQAKIPEPTKKRRPKDINDKKKGERQEQAFSTKLNDKSTKTSNFVNPYPEFDHFFQVKKITDHSIDNLKISSLTFDDVFDKAFFNRIKCNIQENLAHHIDGKLFKNEESESRISNFEKNVNIPQETQNLNTENYGCEISLNAVAPTTMLLSNQLGDDPESQIEYGSKPSKKKTQLKKDEVHYKYFTRRKYQASILEHKENRDLSKLDMWTQYVIKNRQQKILDDKKTPKEILDYFAGEEYKSIMRREELNRILDRRGPFEDLREEASKKAALEKLNGENSTDDDNIAEIGELLNDILNKVFELSKESSPVQSFNRHVTQPSYDVPELPSYLNLRPTGLTSDNEIDRSDKIALICSSQETENFELPSNTVRGKNEKVELTGEWARSRIYVCAACGLKLQNIKQFLEHKSASHHYIWVQHYEFVGNQSELYRHLSIPVLGKVGVLENVVQCKVWKRSDSRLCTKCGKQCNSLGELHRHILECGGDWTWMLARKKCKYRPFGAKSRRKRRGLVKRIYQKTEPTEKKIYKKNFDIPRQKPSDADSIKRMLANLPAKRATRKIISLKDGFNTQRTKQVKSTKQSKFKCGKLIHGKTKEQNKITKPEYEKTNKNQNNNYRRSLRCLNKVLTSRILDTNSSIMVRRKYNQKIKNEQKKKRNIRMAKSPDETIEAVDEQPAKTSPKKAAKPEETTPQNEDQVKEEIKTKRSSPRIEKRLEFSASNDKMNIKRFFPVKKKKKIASIENVKKIQSNKVNTNRKNSKIDETIPEMNPSPQTEEIKNGHVPNLRKRKSDSKNSESSVPKVRKKTRKLRNNVNIITETEVTSENSAPLEEGDFFENNDPKNDLETLEVEPVVINSVAVENTEVKEPVEPPPPENFPVNELELEKNIKIEIDSTVLTTPQTKKKLRKPARGLNDCIAMLTSKLGKNFEESTTSNIFNEISRQSLQENVEMDVNKKPEFILKVPMSNEHFQLRSNSEEVEQVVKSTVEHEIIDNLEGVMSESEALVLERREETRSFTLFDLSDEEERSEVVSTMIRIDYHQEESEQKTMMVEEEEEEEQEQEDVSTKEILNDVNDTEDIQQSTCDTTYNTDSEDEIPLSTLLKEDQCDRVSSVASSNIDDLCVKATEVTSIEEIPNDIINITSEVVNVEKDLDSSEEVKVKEKETVLMEINDNQCQNSETVNSLDNENDNKNYKILDPPVFPPSEFIQNKTADKLSPTDEEVDNFMSLEEHIENHLSKLNKLNFFQKNSVEADVVLDESITAEEPVIEDADSSEYKENSVILAETKPKQKKKSTASKSSTKDVQKQNSKENAASQRVNGNKKSVRSAKAKALESILDDALLELSENELFLQDNLKNVMPEGNTESESSNEKSSKETKSDACTSTKDKEIETVPGEDVDTDQNSPDEVVEDEISDPPKHLDQDIKTDTENSKELRRSSRNSKRVTCYNETDLVDPLLDDIGSKSISKILKETTKDILGIKRKNRTKKAPKNGQIDKKLNGDDLFNLLKTTPNENIVLSKPSTFFNSFDEISNDFNDDNFEAFEDILEKSMAVIEENLSDPAVSNLAESLPAPEKEVSESCEVKTPTERQENKKKTLRKKTKKVKTKKTKVQRVKPPSSDQQNSIPYSDTDRVSSLESLDNDLNSNQGDLIKSNDEKSKTIYCEICDKSFARMESLTKHKRTLTHISKLSELEAKEAALKAKCDLLSTNEESETADSRKNLDILESDTTDSRKNLDILESETTDSRKNLDILESETTDSRKNLDILESETTDSRKNLDILESETTDSRKNLDILESETTDSRKNLDILESETTDSRKNLDILDILENIDERECKQFSSPFSVNVKNSNLKLADIINDVLNKPILKKDEDAHNFSEIMIQNETEPPPEIRRYKSLAERKSFESEDCLKNDHVKNVDYFETEISNAAAGQILEKQITLLENIIENRSSMSYIDELSVSSTQSVNENTYSESGLGADTSKQVESELYPEQCIQESIKPNFEETFLKPSQYEEISEDSNLKNYEEQKSRKALNRDEELFLECCSLLKSGSEVSSYSKKSNNLSKDLNNLELKPTDEPDWLDGNCVSQKENCTFVECSSDSSIMRTPLGDSFSQDDSNSATISSQWDMNNSSTLSKKGSWKEDEKNLTFEEVFNNNKQSEEVLSKEEDEELDREVSSFHRVISEVLKTDLNSSSANNLKKSSMAEPEEVSRLSYENKDASNAEGKKMLTKGAMKVFEGLKVSIPTEELNMDKILTPGLPKVNSPEFPDLLIEDEESPKMTKPVKRNKCPSKTKSKHSSKSTNFKKQNDLQMSSKIHDVYDFEETQDNSDVFTRPDFRSFRNNYEKSKKNDKLEGSDDDSQDGVNFDAFSSSTSSVSEVLPVKSRTQQNITKKKCMIMGRIFKNAVKSRIIDEDIRNIPVIDNSKLVENFVLSCPEPVITSAEKKPRMTEEEMNLAFDNLMNNKANEAKAAISRSGSSSPHKNNLNRRKSKTKNKKRNYGCSDSSDDEFQLQKATKKRPKKKNTNTEESCINLEQELRECIGVASRKSQRKCTSGKQNVLMEYWSSDESSFETMLEKQILESAQNNSSINGPTEKQEPQFKEPKNPEKVVHEDTPSKPVEVEPSHKRTKSSSPNSSSNRRKRVAANPLYHWSSSSEDESRDLIEIRPIRDEIEDDEDRPVQHGWIVGDSPKKLVTMLAQAKGKKCETDGVKEHGKKRTSAFS